MHADLIDQLALTLAVQLHAEQFTDHDDFGEALADVKATASSLRAWLHQPTPDPALSALTQRMTELEDYMTAAMDETRAALAELNAETDNLAARLDQIAETADAETAAAIRPISTRLRGLAADPENPVPPDPEQPV